MGVSQCGTDAEISDLQRQWLAKVYQFLLSLRIPNETAGRDEFGDLTMPAVELVPEPEDRHDDTVHQN